MNYQAKENLLKDRVILVTGAGQGIGQVASIEFAKHGATVILLGKSVKKLESVYDEIVAAAYPEPAIFPLDLEKASEDDFKAMAEGIYQQLGRMDGVLHNAAHFDNLSPLEIQTTQQFEKMLKINLIAPFALTKACLPLLTRADDASIIFTSSSAGHQASAYWGSHGISKQAVEHLVKTWAQELEIHPNIRINAIIPGAVQSPQRKKSHPGEVHQSLPSTESIMDSYLYLMGQDSKGTSGQIIAAQG